MPSVLQEKQPSEGPSQEYKAHPHRKVSTIIPLRIDRVSFACLAPVLSRCLHVQHLKDSHSDVWLRPASPRLRCQLGEKRRC